MAQSELEAKRTREKRLNDTEQTIVNYVKKFLRSNAWKSGKETKPNPEKRLANPSNRDETTRNSKFPSFETRKTTRKMSPCLAMRRENVNVAAQTREKRKSLNATKIVKTSNERVRKFANHENVEEWEGSRKLQIVRVWLSLPPNLNQNGNFCRK